MNLIASQEVEGKRMTIYIDDVPVEDALRAIMEGNGLTYEQVSDSNIYLVKPLGKPKVEMITRIYQLNYIRLAQLSGSEVSTSAQGFIGAIKGLLSQNGSIAQDARSNSIIITDILENFENIEQA